MPPVTPQFVMDLESRMRMIQETEYTNLAAASYMWWQYVAKVLPSQSRREIITWILNTVQLESTGKGGNIAFDDMYVQETEYEADDAGKGLKLRRKQFEDLDGNGVKLATEWVAQMGAQFAYWPQKQIATLLQVGESTLAYDSVNFFANNHPLNPFRASVGTYANLLTGAAASTPSTDPNDAAYPGACPIDVSVSMELALTNLSKVYSYISKIRMPNGSDPRRLRPVKILCSPLLFPRAVAITQAKFLATAAGAAAAQGGSSDVEALIASLGYGMPVQCDELTDDTSYYIVTQQQGSTQLGGLVYVDREPFTIRYYTGRGGGTGVDAILDRADVLEWHSSGRNVAAPGQPTCIFKVKAT